MMDTFNTKADHYSRGWFSTGSGKTKILILGSCRIFAYANYFAKLNSNRDFTINLINLVNFYFDSSGERVTPDYWLDGFETNAGMLEMIRNTDWFLHEHSANFGMLNTDRSGAKHIYKYGMAPRHDLAIPAFNDVCIMLQEFINFDQAIRERARAELSKGELTSELKAIVKQRGLENMNRFLQFCRLSSLPEMADIFEKTWTQTRYFWSLSHVSSEFTTLVFRMLNEKFLQLTIPETFWEWTKTYDPYSNPSTPITQCDIDNYGLKWPQPVRPVKL